MFDTEEIAPPPVLTGESLRAVEAALRQNGPVAAADALVEHLENLGDDRPLFYAMLLRERVKLGVDPFPTGPATDIPPEHHAAYEEAIRKAGRDIGTKLAAAGKFGRAWYYYRILGEEEVLREQLAKFAPGEDDDVQEAIEVAFHHGLAPATGYELLLGRYGICNAITTLGGHDFSPHPEARPLCVRALIRALHEQLLSRIANEVEGKIGEKFAGDRFEKMLVEHPSLFDDGAYHIDTSHLSSVCQYALELDDCPELALARELCLYGEKLPDTFSIDSDPPFESGYRDYRALIEAVMGIDREANVERFRAKLAAAQEEGSTFVPQIFVNLLLRIGREDEARAASLEYLAEDERPGACPDIYALCQKAEDWPTMAEAARKRADGVTLLAALIRGKN